jgi:hypothetical protein
MDNKGERMIRKREGRMTMSVTGDEKKGTDLVMEVVVEGVGVVEG